MSDEFEALKKEYEDFVYIVSHDLSSPLRHVKQFSELLMNGRAEDASDEELLYIDFLHKALGNLDRMQDALLDLSRINTKANEITTFDCNLILQQISAELDKKYSEKSPRIHIDQLPEIAADREKITNAFYQIMDNSLKFHKNSSPPECRIRCGNQEQDFHFSIQDNGIGIPEQYHEEVLKIFRRLHPNDGFPGIGAGLAITKKIVELHKGKLWITSGPADGTTVHFTIPKT